jgi:cell division protease FtsH
MMSDASPEDTSWLERALPVLLMLVLGGFIYVAWETSRSLGPSSAEIPYTQLKSWIAEGKLAQITLRGPRVSAALRDPERLGNPPQSVTNVTTQVPSVGDPELLPLVERAKVPLLVESADEAGWPMAIRMLMPWVFLLGLFYFMQRGATRTLGGMGPLSGAERFLRDRATRAENPNVTFADVAGQQAAKQEVQELVEYLRDPEKFHKLGAQVPRGVLLMGPPGTGKTLLARALAGEAGVPFFSISGSQFIEMFVGVGAARVRSLFEHAREAAPCIVFIDELDAVGRTRGTGLGGGHDEREQTLNQILSEMDGFAGHEPIIVLAATNRPDVLDPALLRPGRFDRHVTLDLPDREDRRALLDVHTRHVPLEPSLDLDRVAAATPGFSGADLKNLVNEAAIQAARAGCEHVTSRHLDEALDKISLGAARSLAMEPEELHRLAVHESGHTAVAYFLPNTDPLHKVSVIPRGSALGGTQQLPEQERYTLPEEYLRARLAVMLGGRVAERDLLGSVSSGADDDISQATALARAMVTRWGMSDRVGPVDLSDAEEQPFLGREIALPRRFSEASAQRVDRAVHDLLCAAEACAHAVLQEHRPAVQRLIQALEREEQLDRARIEALLGSHPSLEVRRAS